MDTARLVKLSGDRLLAMWGKDGNVHYQLLNGKGAKLGQEGILRSAAMPTTQPLVLEDGTVCWIGVAKPQGYADKTRAAIYTLKAEL